MKTRARLAALAAGLLVTAWPASPAAADSSLAAQWHLDEATGSTVSDTSGHGNNGALIGNPSWAPGRFGNALSFDTNTSGSVRVPNNTSLEPTSAVTVSAWVEHAGSPGLFRYVLAKGATGCMAASYGLYSGPDGGLEFYVSSGHGSAYTRSPDAGAGVWDGKWHMIVGTFDAGDVRLYVDGNEVGAGTPRTGPLEYLLPDSNDLFIGDYPGCALHNFVGVIDEVNIWRVALTAAQVKAAFENSSPTSGGSGGQGTLPTGSGGHAGPGTGTGAGNGTGTQGGAPAITHLTVSPSAFALDVAHARRTPPHSAGATISYIDTQAARSTFAVLTRKAGIKTHGRCEAPGRHTPAKHAARCLFYQPLGTFTHADRAGRNSFRFTGLRGHHLASGRYRLDVTPKAKRLTGRTTSAAFTIVR